MKIMVKVHHVNTLQWNQGFLAAEQS